MAKMQKAADLLVMVNPAFASFLIRVSFLLAMVWAGRRTEFVFRPAVFSFCRWFFVVSRGSFLFPGDKIFYITPSGN